MRIKIEPRLIVPKWMSFLGLIAAILAALFFGGFLLSYGGLNPLVAYRQMFTDAFLRSYSPSDTLVKATPLLLAGLGVTVAFRMKLWNIGAEGQLLIGAWAASGVALFVMPPETPRPIMLLAMGVAGFLGGALWGLIPGILKAKLQVNEIISSLMLTYVAILFNNFFIYGPWSAGGFGLTRSFPRTGWFPRLLDFVDFVPAFRGMTAHIGFLIGLVAAVILAVLFRRSKWGYELKLIGDNPRAAEYAGVNLARHIMLAMFISGGLAGLAGMSEVAGVVHRLQENFSPGYGFTAIIVAWLARLNPLAVVLVAYLFGGLLVGGDSIQPAGIPLMIQGIIMFCVISADLLTRYRIRLVRPKSQELEALDTEVTAG
ncbi:MAG: ABC transporter permease [Chloroflexi bacterium]|nr:MAG: ABC transporter permease [Chloroflexota bacterium]